MKIASDTFVLFFWAVQIAAGIYGGLRILLNPHIGRDFAALKIGIALAKIGAAWININTSLLLVSMSRAILTQLSMTKLGLLIPIDKLVRMHRACGCMFIAGSILHMMAHIGNVCLLSTRQSINLLGPTFIWAFLLIISYTVVAGTAFLKTIRRRFYELFYFTHYLAPISIVFMWLHGAHCFLRDSRGKCAGSNTLYWVGPALIFYLVDSLYSLARSLRFAFINKLIDHPSDVLEVQIRKPGFIFSSGQYVYLKIPAITWLEWHPFTLTSAPEEDHLSIHVHLTGDWTQRMRETLADIHLETTRIFIDGPYGCASQQYERFTSVVCIGAGIGQTPFASILKSLWFRMNFPLSPINLKSVHYLGICRQIKSFEWFNDVLRALEKADVNGLLNFHCYLTGIVTEEDQATIAAHHELGLCDPITGLQSPTRFGRPNLSLLFQEWSKTMMGKVGLLYCGPPKLGEQIKQICSTRADEHVTWEYHEEAF